MGPPLVRLFFVAQLGSSEEAAADEDKTLCFSQVSSLFLIKFIHHFFGHNVTARIKIDVFPMGNFRFQVDLPLRTTQLDDESSETRRLFEKKGDTISVKIEATNGDKILFLRPAVRPRGDPLLHIKRETGTNSPLSKHPSLGVRQNLVNKLIEPGVKKRIRSGHSFSCPRTVFPGKYDHPICRVCSIWQSHPCPADLSTLTASMTP